MRERLVDILKSKPYGYSSYEDFADYLLENGVIVAPMPMAEGLRQELTEYVHQRCVDEL